MKLLLGRPRTDDCRPSLREVSTQAKLVFPSPLSLAAEERGARNLQVLYPRCCGLDIHQKMGVACVLLSDPDGTSQRFVRTFGTMTADLLALGDWLEFHAVRHVAMERTGVLWRPVFNVLEEGRTLIVVNAQHSKAVPGRKTDVKLRHEVAQVAVGAAQAEPNLVFCHQYPTVACDWSNLTV